MNQPKAIIMEWNRIIEQADEARLNLSVLHSMYGYMENDELFNPAIEERINKMVNYIENTFDVGENEVRQKPIITPERRKLYVDPCMRPILTHLWSRGVKTVFSCSGHYPLWSAYILIKRNEDFEKYCKKSAWDQKIRDRNDFVIYSNKKGFSSEKKTRDLFLKWLLEY